MVGQAEPQTGELTGKQPAIRNLVTGAPPHVAMNVSIVLKRLPHSAFDHGRIFIGQERGGSLKFLGPGYENAKATPARIG